ncbi:acetyl esterase/lipase [Neorhizobium sp. 2083]|uniref:alpha/beta hydrolase n=1 Tax=Neorhizobium sp. 2083 TaxID=2817762 RepID=UPI002856EFED|nr:alpha/beta hydrolase fold domain-containing protein [Neorhizobium sp. 2083]MDR6820108.1 acetyl esterase/lipase [Neorhizobium sp. 2083]
MEIDPASVFDQSDVAGARRLNRVLSWLPRYHTGRRVNARLINGLLKLGQRVVPDRQTKGIEIKTLKLPFEGRDVPVRILQATSTPAALFLHFHGGAWVLGNSRLDDGWNAGIARACNVTAASGDFHLALDDNLDRAIEDAVNIADWALDHLAAFGTHKLIVEGESSGAHLAACALQRLAARRSLKAVAGFVSLCGAFNMAGSRRLKASGSELIVDPASALKNLRRLTRPLSADAAINPTVSPLFADLAGMPPALFIAGALDPIAEDSRDMHARWQAQVGDSDILVAPEAPHGFERLPTQLAAKTRRFMYGWINRAIETSLS